jgi:hypothetical protein|tara:strand:+ start:124 stop:963 length:840 start_codon:yes stop_codon:yes gene_type:complete
MRKIKTTKIGQKDYVDVSERVLAFNDLYPIESGYSLRQEIVSINEETGTILIHAWVENAEGKVLRDGHAHEFQANKKSKVNMTSHVENCETSAVGRALGFMGLGTEYGIASADEVRNAQAKEVEMKEAEGSQVETKPAPKKVKEEKKPAEQTPPPVDNKTLAGDATDEQLESITGKPVTYEVRHNSPESTTPSSTKEAEERLDDSESEEEYLVDLNRRVSMLKNEEDAKALASEGRQWSNNWVYKKDQYKALYKCISESFAAFKKSQDTAKLAGIKGGS